MVEAFEAVTKFILNENNRTLLLSTIIKKKPTPAFFNDSGRQSRLVKV